MSRRTAVLATAEGLAALLVVGGGMWATVAAQDAADAPPSGAATALSAPAPARGADPFEGIRIADPDPAAEARWDAADDPRVQYFGRPWIDTDRNGCATDDDIQRRDLVAWTARGRCGVTGGVLPESYDGGPPVPRVPHSLQLDHVDALHRVYVTGGAELDQATRVLIANDPDNLIYTNTRSNESKGDASPSEYLPASPGARCRYVVQYLTVVKRYGLTLTAADVVALRATLAACPAGPA